MKKILLKWIELRKIKFEYLYCKHSWELISDWNIKNEITGSSHEKFLMLYCCKKCGKFEKIDMNN